jgi:hypothetical protein
MIWIRTIWRISMEKYEYQVVTHRIREIEQEQLHVLDHVRKYLDRNINMQRYNIQDKMLQLLDDKEILISSILQKTGLNISSLFISSIN